MARQRWYWGCWAALSGRRSDCGLLYGSKRSPGKKQSSCWPFAANAGPAFIFRMVGGLFGSGKIAAVLFAIHIISAVLTQVWLFGPGAPSSCSDWKSGPPPPSSWTFRNDGGGGENHGAYLWCIILFHVITAFLTRALGT